MLVAALVVLDASLTFENIWPTPAVQLAWCAFHRARRLRAGSWRSSAAGRVRCRAPRLRGSAPSGPSWSSVTTRRSPRRRCTAATSTCTGICGSFPMWRRWSRGSRRGGSSYCRFPRAVLTLILLYALVRRAWRCVAASLTDDHQRRALIALSLAVVAWFIVHTCESRSAGRRHRTHVCLTRRPHLCPTGQVRRGSDGGIAHASRQPADDLRPLARTGRGRVSRVRRVVRRGQLRPAGARSADRREPGTARRGDSRNRPSGGLCVRRVADIRRIVVARPHQPSVRHRGARPRHQREADDGPAGHAGEGIRPPRIPHGRTDARSPSELAGRRVLWVQRNLRSRTPGLLGARVRLVRPSGPVLARTLRRARGRHEDRLAGALSSFPPSAHTFRSDRRRRTSRTGRAC